MEKEKVWKSIKSKVNSKSRLSKHVNKLASIYSWTDLMLSSIYRGVFQPQWAGLVYFADPQSMDCRIGLLNRLLSFCLYHLDSSFLVLLTIILTAPLGAWHRFDLLFAMELHCVIWPWSVSASDKVAKLRMQIFFAKLQNKKNTKFIFNNNKNIQRRGLWVSRSSCSGFLAAKLFSASCPYFMNVTRKRQYILVIIFRIIMLNVFALR